MADTLESLEIEVKHSATGAAGEIGSVANAIADLGSQLQKVLPSLENFVALQKTLSSIKGGIKINNIFNGSSADPQHSSSGNPSNWAQEMTATIESSDQGFFANMRDVLDTSGIQEAAAGVSEAIQEAGSAAAETTRELSPLASAAHSVAEGMKNVASSVLSVAKSGIQFIWKGITTAAKGAKSAISSIKSSIDGLKKSVKNVLPGLSNFLSSLKRIAFYRFIRFVIKAITEAFSEGLKTAYAFSQQADVDADRFAAAMDSMSSASAKMKNQLGAAFAALLALIAPIVNAIISLITRLAAALTQLFSAFTGDKYLKAGDVASNLADDMERGGGAAKEWKNQLLGFDELNRLNEPSQGGGGGGLGDMRAAFEAAEIEQQFKDFASKIKTMIAEEDWEGIGSLLGEKINSIFPSADMWHEWGNKLGFGLDAAAKILYSTLSTIDWNSLGVGVGNFINGTLEKIDFSVWGRILVKKTTLALDFLMGSLSSLDWNLLGKSVGDFLHGAFDEAGSWLKGKDWKSVGDSLYQKIKEFIEGMDFAELANSFFSFLGSAFGAAIALLDGFFSGVWEDISEYFKEKTEECGGDAWEGFKKGITDALVGIGEWIKTNVIDPFVNSFKEILGIHSPSTVFEGFGDDVIEGFKNGIVNSFSNIYTWCDTNIVQPFINAVDGLFGIDWSGVFSGLVTWANAACVWLDSVLYGIGLVKAASGSTFHSEGGFNGRSGKFAEGGFVDEGQLFVAREAGPELVGTMNGRTAVANNDQIVEGIRQGVFEAVSAAMNGGNQDVNVKVYLDSRQIRAGQERLERAWG